MDLYTLESGESCYNDDKSVNMDYVLWLEEKLEKSESDLKAPNSEYKSPSAQSCLNCAEAISCLPTNEACFKEKT